jgi:hypothetical protein
MIQMMLGNVILNYDHRVVAKNSGLSVAKGKGRVLILATSLLS